MTNSTSRRLFLSSAAAAGTAVSLRADTRPAILGGTPVRKKPFPSWPRITEQDERAWLDVLRSKQWYRRGGSRVSEFEQAFAERLGVRRALATNGGTTALFAALNALEVGPKDEVIVPPYTFVATINVVLLQYALPVFVDTDRATFQMDAGKIEAAISPRTRCILPVHMGGSSADLDKILAIGEKHGIPVVEDACQAHLAEWRGRKVGSLGAAGCFSFQASKNLNCGEGGLLVTSDDDLYDRAVRFHNNGNSLGGPPPPSARRANGCNLRMTEFQGALLSTQSEAIEQQARTREQNAAHLTKLFAEIPGIHPARLHDGCTRSAYHLYMFRYDKTEFSDLPRERFMAALKAEGIPVSSGYRPLNRDPLIENTLRSRSFRAVYSEKEIEQWRAANRCPENDRLCSEALWLSQKVLLGTSEDMDQIAQAVAKVRRSSSAIRGA